MSTIQVLAPGLQTSVQDLGREGYGPIGVSPSGAADPISLRLGNRLVGNDEGAAGLEMMLLGGTFIFPEGAVVALTGSDFGATLNDARLEMGNFGGGAPRPNDPLGPTNSGARCYLCVQGGIAVQPFLGSASTQHLERPRRIRGQAAAKGRRDAHWNRKQNQPFPQANDCTASGSAFVRPQNPARDPGSAD